MLKRTLFLSILGIFCLPLMLSAKIFTSVADGNWHTPATWGETSLLPTTADTVIVNGHDIILNSSSVYIRYLKITNMNGSNINVAKIDMNAGVTLNILGDLDIIAENVNQDTRLMLSSSSIINVGGDMNITRTADNSQSADLIVKLSNTAQLNVTGELNYHYLGSGSEAGYELYAQNTSILTVTGNANFNQSGGANFSLIATGDASINFESNLNLEASGGSGIEFTVTGLADITIDSSATLTNSGATLVHLTAAADGDIIIKENLNLESTTANSNVQVNVTGVGSSLDINEDITFSALSPGDATLSQSGGSEIFLSGNIERGSLYGSIEMTNDDQFYFDGTIAQSLPQNNFDGTGTDSLNFTNLIFNNSEGMILSGNLVIEKNIDISAGIIQTSDAALLILKDGATITGGSKTSYVNGPMVKIGSTGGSSFIFPVGNNGQYAPIEIAAVSSSTTEYKAKYTGCPPPVGHLANNFPLEAVVSSGYWDLERADGLPVGDIKLHWSDANQAGILDTSKLVVAYLKDNATGWFPLGKGGVSLESGVSTAGFIANDIGCPPPVGSSTFTIGSTDAAALPVELIKFQADWNKQSNRVNLFWETGSETNSDHFIVEKSVDGFRFDAIEEKNAAINSNTIQYYSSVDKEPLKGNNYYRIMSVDRDGMMSFSKTINVFIKEYETLPVAYPNPVDDYVRIYSKLLANQEVEVELFDMTGRRVYHNRHQANQGQIHLLSDEINMKRVGNYLLSYKYQGMVYSMKVTKRP